MSSFTTPADLRMLGGGQWELLAPFEYHVGSYPSKEVIVVPVGFVTDLASVPRIFWAILPPFGRYAKAAIIHDYLYKEAIKTKQYADDVFLECMQVLKVVWWREKVMYWMVRIIGNGNYK